ncbi:MAG: hypothetical protein IKQ29_02960 [Bacilli bacterium]|nr:hypothetical protein [Bacilli bacterium]
MDDELLDLLIDIDNIGADKEIKTIDLEDYMDEDDDDPELSIDIEIDEEE